MRILSMHCTKYGIRGVGFAGLAILVVLSGCTTGAKLRGQASEIRSQNETIHDRARRCSPKALAQAESQVEFGLYELSQGNFNRAKDHIYAAEKFSKTADEESDYDACRSREASMEVETAEAVDIPDSPDDQDGDGMVDTEDECPLDPEDFDDFEDEDGCPDSDNDDDGILDESDTCMNIAEDVDGYQDEDGCPDIDNDADGLEDINDQCPTNAEDFDGFEDEDGCPETDNDEDDIADILDECPQEAEDYDGDVDDDGCSEERERVKVEKDRIHLNEKVHFATDKADIQPQSYPLLNEVAEVMLANVEINVRIEGHTDSRGSESYNQELSQRRAESVVEYLDDRGVERSRLEAKGFGEQRPIEDNATEEGRAANRRVEIHITNR